MRVVCVVCLVKGICEVCVVSHKFWYHIFRWHVVLKYVRSEEWGGGVIHIDKKYYPLKKIPSWVVGMGRGKDGGMGEGHEPFSSLLRYNLSIETPNPWLCACLWTLFNIFQWLPYTRSMSRPMYTFAPMYNICTNLWRNLCKAQNISARTQHVQILYICDMLEG